MNKFIIVLLSFFIFSCSSFQTQEQLNQKEIIEMVKDQKLLVILNRNLDELSIPTEYYFSDIYMVVDGNSVLVYNYSDSLIKNFTIPHGGFEKISKTFKIN